jgi:hypothetical protein
MLRNRFLPLSSREINSGRSQKGLENIVKEMPDLFVSYSRKDGMICAHKLEKDARKHPRSFRSA